MQSRKNDTRIAVLTIMVTIIFFGMIGIYLIIFVGMKGNILQIPTEEKSPTLRFNPGYTATPLGGWSMKILPLYKWKVELPTGWTITEMNRRPEPTDPGAMGSTLMGHDCVDYQLISPDRMEFINVTLPCGFSEGIGGPCGQDAVYIQAVDSESYLVRHLDYAQSGWVYEIASPGTYEDINGSHTELFCMNNTSPVYFYWELGKNYWEMDPNNDINRIMLSLLKNNQYP